MKTPSKAHRRMILNTLLLLAVAGVICPLLYNNVDLPVARYAREQLPPLLVHAAKLTDDFDDYIITAFAISALFVLIRYRNMPLFQKLAFPPLAALAAGISVNILKPLFGRWRPSAYFKHGDYGFEYLAPIKSSMASFPSGHTTDIIAIMTAIALLNARHTRAACFIFAVMIASCRIIVGAHYPADVFAGLVLGYL